MSSWSISGVPRTIQTIILTIKLIGLKPCSHERNRPWQRIFANGAQRFIDPKDITSPKGSAPMSVIANSFKVCKKPIFSEFMTVSNIKSPASCQLMVAINQPKAESKLPSAFDL